MAIHWLDVVVNIRRSIWLRGIRWIRQCENRGDNYSLAAIIGDGTNEADASLECGLWLTYWAGIRLQWVGGQGRNMLYLTGFNTYNIPDKTQGDEHAIFDNLNNLLAASHALSTRRALHSEQGWHSVVVLLCYCWRVCFVISIYACALNAIRIGKCIVKYLLRL